MKYHIFDLDGTLVDSMPNWQKMMLSILDEMNVTYPDDVIRTITPMGNTGSAEYFINKLHVNLSTDELLQKMDDYSLKEYDQNILLKDGIKEYLQKLKKEGYKLFVLTASPHRFTDPCLKNNGVFDLFDIVWSIDDFGDLKKDNVEIYFEVAKKLNCKPSDIVFYDDNLIALTTCKKAGLETVGIYDKCSDFDQDNIKKIVDKYVLSFRDLL